MYKFHALILAAALTASPLAFAGHDGNMGEHCDMKKQGMLKEADANKDGSIDKSEARAMHEKHFDEADANKDGKLSADEIRKCDQHKHGSMHEKGTQGFVGADKNGDGKLDRKEAEALPNVSKNFDAIDANKDSLLERDEVHTFMKNRRQ